VKVHTQSQAPKQGIESGAYPPDDIQLSLIRNIEKSDLILSMTLQGEEDRQTMARCMQVRKTAGVEL
jgi:hypothetical protein